MIGIIDIGSNSIRLMIAENSQSIISKELDVARLGEGLVNTGRLKMEKMEVASSIVETYVNKARNAGATKVFVYATEAVRVASNRDEFMNMVYKKTGVHIHLIPNTLEAKLGFSGAYSGDSDLAVVDIGGASTEITVGDSTNIKYSKSLPIGCVRMRDRCGEDDDKIAAYIDEMLPQYGNIPSVNRVCFVAGTASIVVTMKLKMEVWDADKVTGQHISLVDLDEQIYKVMSTPMEERQNIVGLPASKIDVVYQGMLLIRAILGMLKLDEFYFSDSDSLEGYAKYLEENNLI